MNATNKTSEESIVAAIKSDLQAALIAKRLRDVAYHIDELNVIVMHTQNTNLKKKCVAILDGAAARRGAVAA